MRINILYINIERALTYLVYQNSKPKAKFLVYLNDIS